MDEKKMRKINLLFVPVNETEIDFDEIRARLSEKDFTEKVNFDVFFQDESIEIPTEMERAAPWHVCPVTEEIRDIDSARCHRLNYCLMYVVDEIEKLTKKNSEIDFVVLLFPKMLTRGGSLVSLVKNCICIKNDFEKIIEALSVLTDFLDERGEI